MKCRRSIILLVAAALSAALSQTAPAVEIGDPAPDFSGIIGTDGEEHALVNLKKAKLVVLAFTCNHCPVAKAYEDRLVALQKDYRKQGVRLVAVNVNNVPADRLDKMKERAAEKKFNFPYLYDESQKIGLDYGANKTPHVFVLDGQRKIAYMGAIDDNMNGEAVEKHYLRDAVDALLAGKTPSEPVTKQFGCGIKYEK